MDGEIADPTGSELLSQLNGENGDYKRVLLVRFLHDQARFNQKFDSMSLDDETSSEDNDIFALAEPLEATSLNPRQLHKRRIERENSAGPGERRKNLLSKLDLRPKSCVRMNISPSQPTQHSERRSCSSDELHCGVTPRLASPGNVDRASERERGLNFAGRISIDPRSIGSSQQPSPLRQKMTAMGGTPVARGASNIKDTSGSTLVKLPALFKHPGTKFESAPRLTPVKNA